MTATREVLVNGRWPLQLPEHRAARPEWPWWEATRLAAMAHHIGPGDVVWDVGAEEGDFPALWARWGAEVVLAEPNERVWPNIRLIFDANDLPAPLFCWPGFLGETSEDVTWDDPIAGWPPSADGPVIGDHGFCQLGERPDIPTTSIDDLVGRGVRPPTVLTMDVEGAELFVIHGAVQTIRRHRPKVFISIHPAFMANHYGHRPDQIHDLFDALEYDRKFLTNDHEEHWMYLPRQAAA